MQHYGLKTNVIDFSDNAFIALYIALKYYTKEDFKEKKQRHCVLYLLNPVIYNKFRQDRILTQLRELNFSNEDMHRAMSIYGVEDYDNFYGYVPNISIGRNEKLYARYILGNSELDNKSHYMIKGSEIKALPVAIWTPRLNHRIRTQSGSFIAFDLYSNILDTDNKLEAIQDEEIKNHPDNPCIFLYKISISKDCCKDICDTLMTMGISRQFVYPEIDHVKYKF